MQQDELRKHALEYHEFPTPGKVQVTPTKPLANQRDLALAYSPGVAAACDAIVEDPSNASRFTSRGNLVAVISNGTAVLGLGDIGPLAAKPVMEGKGVLFKKFAGIDVFDIEINEKDPDKLIDIIASLEPTFGGINLEDIKAPECFYIEKKLRERMKIPVFHDDQHGTAIIVGAAVLNALRVIKKDIAQVRVVTSGAGAAAIACLDLLVGLGVQVSNIIVCDSKGVVYQGREENMPESKARYATNTPHRNLTQAVTDADIFLGLSGPGVLTPEMLKTMAANPIIMALANPVPEILPEIAKAARADAIVCTGRSDYPNQVNNVLGFPFIFRGALDVGATTINEAMKLACVRAIADLALVEQSDVVSSAYGTDDELRFGREYLIPKPFDPRLIIKIAPAVAKAAMDSGVATRPIADFEAYTDNLTQFVYHSGLLMKPVFAAAKHAPKRRVVYCEGEEDRVLRAVQVVIDEGIAHPILVGRPHVVQMRIEKLGLRMRPHVDFDLINIDDDPRYREYWTLYHRLMERKGVSVEYAKREARRRTTLIGSMLMLRGEADAMLCGTFGHYQLHLDFVMNILGCKPGVNNVAAMNALMTPQGAIFITDTYVHHDPSPEVLAEITVMAAEVVRRFGVTPKVALLSHSSFGSVDTPSAEKMRKTLQCLNQMAPDLEAEGEMHGDAALSEEIRQQVFPNARFKGRANLLVMPGLDAANISFNLLKTSVSQGVTIGPMLMGVSKPVHILTPTATVRRIVNMTAIAVMDANVSR